MLHDERVLWPLRGVVQPLLERYRDRTLSRRLWQAELEAEIRARDEIADLWDEFQSDIDDMRAQAEQVVGQYESQFRDLAQAFESSLAPIRDAEKTLRQAILIRAEEIDVDWPDVPEPETAGDEGLPWLYDSSRDYLGQLESYKAYQTNGVVAPSVNGHAERAEQTREQLFAGVEYGKRATETS